MVSGTAQPTEIGVGGGSHVSCLTSSRYSSYVHRDTAVARAAASQHGVATHVQLRRLGLSNEQISNRLERGHLLSMRVYRHAAAP